MSPSTDRYLRYLKAEREAALMYRALAELVQGERRDALLELARIEDEHAGHWVELLAAKGIKSPPETSTLPPSDEALLQRARQYSLDAVLDDLEQAEVDAQSVYDDDPDATARMVKDEHEHAHILNQLRQGQPDDVDNRQPSDSARMRLSADEVRERLNSSERWHRTDKSGSLRAAVFGVSDGLVSNTALVMGFAGSGIQSNTVLFAGLAGLLAGAFSMGAGEFVSVSSQKDIFTREISLERKELEEKPEEEQRELELIYRAKGLSRSAAKEAAAQIMANPETALDTLAREELGLDPSELGSPVKVAVSSFVAFAVGACVPVIPYIFAGGTLAMVLAIAFAIVALVVVGGAVGRLSGLGVTKSAARQLAVGGGAAAITYLLGSLVGIGLG